MIMVPPNKDWMKLSKDDRLNAQYELGVDAFVKYAIENTGTNEIRCPCTRCKNSYVKSAQTVKDHLIVWGIFPSYKFWYHHGERVDEPNTQRYNGELEEWGTEDGIQTLIRDMFPGEASLNENTSDRDSNHRVDLTEEPNEEAKKFYRVLEGFEKPLYPGSETSSLSANLNLLHIKSLGRWSNKSFTMLLEYLKTELLPKDSSLPDSYYEAKKTIKDLGLSYKKIDACVNDCILFWKRDEDEDNCKVCGASRWKHDKHSGEKSIKKNGKRIAQKTLRYFPLKPRLQRLFMCSKTASDMAWHHSERIKDGVLRHPADSESWKHFDNTHPYFSSEPRNVRLGLASDGFQPFSNSSTSYSIWPVMLIPYNLPPWVCMKQSNFLLSMLIPGPTGPGDAIDVYLQPLIEELNELWEDGVPTYDASRKQNFRLHAALLSTINDFPAYANLSGWSTKGKLACPCCHKETHSMRLRNCCKQVYMRNRRFLPIDHSLRKKKDLFGTVEKGVPPKPLSGDEVLKEVKDLEGICLSKDPRKRTKVSHDQRGDNWTKRSIFFDLPYWKTILLRHNLDVMHVEKNVCDIVLGTIMKAKGKTKDTLNCRLDMQEMGIMPELHPIEKGDKLELPAGPYTLTPDQKDLLCKFLKDVKVPDGFSSNISRCVNLKECKISGLKSHDCHVLLQRLLPLALRGLLAKDLCEAMIELAMIFKSLCAKSLKIEDLEQLKVQIPQTLFKLELWLPPSCFDVMLHLVVHLADEAILNGPVYFRWMYPVERYLYTLKLYIRNKARPEGSIAEGYLSSECLTMCSRYLESVETKFNLSERNYDGGSRPDRKLSLFSHPGRPLGSGKPCNFDTDEREQAHFYALKNCEEVAPFFDEFSSIIAQEGEILGELQRDRKFAEWFKVKVQKLYEEGNCPYPEELLSLARGPTSYATSFTGYITKGFRFHTQRREVTLRSQNSGVVVLGNTGSGNNDYYGVLTEVIRLQYLGNNSVVFFRCNWFDVNDSEKGIKVDKFGFVSVNSQQLLRTNESFVLASQVDQVFYTSDLVNKRSWKVAVKTQPRNTYDIPPKDVEDSSDDDNLEDLSFGEEAYQEDQSFSFHVDTSNLVDMENRSKMNTTEPEILDISFMKNSTKKRMLEEE